MAVAVQKHSELEPDYTLARRNRKASSLAGVRPSTAKSMRITEPRPMCRFLSVIRLERHPEQTGKGLRILRLDRPCKDWLSPTAFTQADLALSAMLGKGVFRFRASTLGTCRFRRLSHYRMMESSVAWGVLQ